MASPELVTDNVDASEIEGNEPVLVKKQTLLPVSYTHLTLPTIYSV